MEQLIIKSNWLVSRVTEQFVRYLYKQIDWDWRMVGIIGARGVGKSTLLLQHLKNTHGISKQAVYVSLDDFYFTNNRLYDFVEQYRALGCRYFYLDEVHKYPTWARELKNLYDTYSDINLIFTGSSIIDILKEKVDLSRRAVLYKLNGLSFREYLSITNLAHEPAFTLDEVLTNHVQIANEIALRIKPLEHFSTYLKQGYYPFIIENANVYNRRIEQIIQLVLETDLNFVEGFNPRNISKIKHLLYIIALQVPFTPNIVQLSQKIDIHRNTLIEYLHYLEKTELLKLAYHSGKSVSSLQKPDKIYLNNANLSYVISGENVNPGTVRETFFINQLAVNHSVNLAAKGDFLVDGNYTFEIGGKTKDYKQIADIQNSFIALADIETGIFNKIPLWLFGMLY